MKLNFLEIFIYFILYIFVNVFTSWEDLNQIRLLAFFLSRTEEPTKAGTCARDRRALQQLALNVHVKHSDLTWPASLLNLIETNKIKKERY